MQNDFIILNYKLERDFLTYNKYVKNNWDITITKNANVFIWS